MISLFLVNMCLVALTLIFLDIREYLKGIKASSERIAESVRRICDEKVS